MNGQRLTEQLELAFTPAEAETSATAGDDGAEPDVAKCEPERPAVANAVMEAVCERENLKKALRRVKANKGSPGIDGMTVDQLPDYLRTHWQTHRGELLCGLYTPSPVRRVEIPKPEGGVRKLGIPTVLDRFIQQAVLQVLQPAFDPTFSPHSYGFRPGRSAHQAVAAAQGHLANGYRWVVDLDLEKFFDRVNHDLLMGQLARRVTDTRVLTLVRAFLNAGVLEEGFVSATEEGTPQGGPLSPLLSNIVLHALDGELERRGHRFVRYADDCNVYVRSARAGHRVMASLTLFITTRLKLKVNAMKSAVAPARVRTFLGFSFTLGQRPKRRLAAKTLVRVRARVRALTRRMRGISLHQMVRDLAAYLLGWRAYFGFCQTPTVLQGLDHWIRRRLRAVVWTQWYRVRTRFRELRRRGVNAKDALLTARTNRGPWRVSRTAALSWALPGAYFDSLGLPHLHAGVTA
jgi:RNA-directed DNA polymerase